MMNLADPPLRELTVPEGSENQTGNPNPWSWIRKCPVHHGKKPHGQTVAGKAADTEADGTGHPCS